ncbi:hypothetical protein X777_10891 [Ooceraea biroi]|uniref:Uncharacterized protein n=1 Tax=Ooceraea biroi TaxID=2015173 RepID=A0A026W5H6_OOCBI|nr:hypothetical protein X777_10891 [Ooceraea biroi]
MECHVSAVKTQFLLMRNFSNLVQYYKVNVLEINMMEKKLFLTKVYTSYILI